VALIVDTGPLFAALHADDRDHARCAALFDTDEEIVVPIPVIVEAEWLATSRLGPTAFDAVYDDLASGALQAADLTAPLLQRVGSLTRRYADLPLGLVDASVIALAEALDEPKIATLDHRHFTVVRPTHVVSLRLLPD
jgi:uncharacterized protein